MPEGDTIHRLAARIERWFAGETVADCLDQQSSVRLSPLLGQQFLGATSQGKHLLMRFSGGWTVHSHLRMHGSWSTSRPNRAAAHLPRVGLRFEQRTLWGVGLPLLELYPTTMEHRRLTNIGPDLIREPISAESLLARLQSIPDAPLSGALLRQGVAAGLGNLYAVEIPFLVGLSPYVEVGRLENPHEVWRLGSALLRANACLGPQTTTGHRGRGLIHYIYGRGGRACPICQSRVDGVREGGTPWGRALWFCTGCQPAEACRADIDRATRLLRKHRLATDLLANREDRLERAKLLTSEQRLRLLF